MLGGLETSLWRRPFGESRNSMLSLTLPYFRERQSLPADLPTKHDIENASEDLPCIREPRFGRVVNIRQLFVVKYGLYVSENEGHALLFIEQHLCIPAPRLYAMYREGRTLYLVMEYLPGTNLQSIWGKLTEEHKLFVTDGLRRICNQMRALPAPSYFGSVSGGPYLHRFFLTVDPDPLINGPFTSSAEIGSALAKHSQKNWDFNARRGFTAEWFARHLPIAFHGHKSVFTHADLHPRNILVREEVTRVGQEQQTRYVVSAVVDWESAGWYPDFWEYAASFVDFDWTDDWPEKYELVVETRPLEATLLKFVRQDLDY